MFVGYVSFSKATDEIVIKVIVFMATTLNGSWKIPLGYYYVDYYVNRLSVEIVSVTFNGDAANIKMVEMLGDLQIESKYMLDVNFYTSGAVVRLLEKK
jgi:hypothetical protein